MVQHTDDDSVRLHALIEERGRGGVARLPAEPKLCEILGVSRSRLRTLLKRAEAEGLIWRHVGKGTFAGARPPIGTEAMRDLPVSVGDLFDARALIEPQLAAQAALHANPSDIAAMEVVLADMAATRSFAEWKRLDAKLHRLIAHATHNALLLLLYDTLHAPMRWGLDARLEEVFGAPPGPRTAANADHSAVVAAISAHHPGKAEELMRDHIVSVRSFLFGRS
ncbi:FadR/GntR family transcriptional regulator [Sphingopyxis sp. GC21]|uniref:FadR/GntR family transcriptional regulator n=1 Tax=Sphingopyxis sp. GC21 TaxID=2933562 RepID=UPI0021E4A428|nr:FCD domain-containing protein [Sphingopyxis sp. GC21]